MGWVVSIWGFCKNFTGNFLKKQKKQINENFLSFPYKPYKKLLTVL